MPVSAVDLPFKEQAEFFRRKLNLPTETWTDIYTQEHDFAFVVAGANRDAIVADFRAAVDKVINEGGTLEQFRKDFDEIVKRNGWSYNGGRNWRSRVIYETNLNTSYQAGRYEQLLAVRDERPYWQYLHNDSVEFPRPQHQAWDGLILRWDDPWWTYHFPPGGWGCQCRVVALSDYDLKVMGRTVDTAPPIKFVTLEVGKRGPMPRTVRVPEGIDPGFEYIPGQSRLQSAVPKPLPPTKPAPGIPNARPRSELPSPQKAPAPLPDNLTSKQYVDAFLEQFNAVDEPAIFKDAVDEALVVGRDMFKSDPGPMAEAIAQTLKSPDEIWTRIENIAAKPVVKRRYIAELLLPGESSPTAVVLEFSKDGWTAITSTGEIKVDPDDYRVGVRLFRRLE